MSHYPDPREVMLAEGKFLVYLQPDQLGRTRCRECGTEILQTSTYKTKRVMQGEREVPVSDPVWQRAAKWAEEEEDKDRQACFEGEGRPLCGSCDTDSWRDDIVYPTEDAPPPQAGQDEGKAVNEQERTSVLKLGVEVLRCLCARVCSAFRRR